MQISYLMTVWLRYGSGTKHFIFPDMYQSAEETLLNDWGPVWHMTLTPTFQIGQCWQWLYVINFICVVRKFSIVQSSKSNNKELKPREPLSNATYIILKKHTTAESIKAKLSAYTLSINCNWITTTTNLKYLLVLDASLKTFVGPPGTTKNDNCYNLSQEGIILPRLVNYPILYLISST